MIHFVIKQVPFYGKTVDRNVRIGGYRTLQSAQKAAKRESPAFVKDATGAIVGQTIWSSMPGYIA